MRAKAKKTPMCSANLISIELKGLAAPGDALKNQRKHLIYNYLADPNMDSKTGCSLWHSSVLTTVLWWDLDCGRLNVY